MCIGSAGAAAFLALLARPALADDPALPPAPAAEILTVGVPDGPAPVAGFDRALFAGVGREAGFAVVFVAAPPGAALADLDAGRIDAAAGPYAIGPTEKRRPLVPVLTEGDVLLRRRGDASVSKPADAAGKRIGLLGPPIAWAGLRSEAVALGARVAGRPGGFAFDPLRDLVAGRLAALVGALPEVATAILARPDEVEAVGPLLGRPVRLAPLVRADRPDVASRLAAALARMRADGRLADLQRRWFGLVFDPPEPRQPPPTSTAKP